LLITVLAGLVGTATLVFITVKYYWGERGTPPVTGKRRRQLKEEELRLRARQIEYVKTHPRKTRKESFWDNTPPT
jgi:hypothetical protein